MNNYPAADQEEAAAAANNQLLLNRQQRQYYHPDSSTISPPQSPSFIPKPTRNNRTSGAGNASLLFTDPEEWYKDANATNFESARDNARTSASTNLSFNMASPQTKASSRLNNNGTMSKMAESPLQRKELLKPVGMRSVSEPASQKLHPTLKSSPAIGTGTRSVKEMANRFDKQAESRNIQSKTTANPPPKLPISYRQPISPSSERSRAASDNHTKGTTRAGQATRDVGNGVAGPARATARSKFTMEDQQSATSTNRVRASSRTPGSWKQAETSIGRIAPQTSSPPPKSPPKERPLLFGEVPNRSATGPGYGILASHTRGSSDSATEIIKTSPSTASDNSPQSISKSTRPVPNGQKSSPHTRTISDTSGRRTNGATTRRPLHQPPSSSSSNCSETSRKIAPPSSRLPTTKRLSNPSTSTSSPSSTRSSSPFSAKVPQKGIGKSSTGPCPNGRAVTNGTPSKTRYNRPTNSNAGAFPAHSPPRSSRAQQSVADKTTSASRNRERETSRNRAPSQSGSPRTRPSPPRATARRAQQINLPLDKVDLALRRRTVRERTSQSIYRQEQTELRRQQSLKAQNSSPAAPEIKKEENVKGDEEDEELASVTEIETIPINSEIDTEQERKASESLPLRIDTSSAPGTPVTLSIAEVLQRPSDDSPTLGIPGSFPSAQPSPMFEEVPQSAVSNATETTDIENDPQDDFQIPGSFNDTNPNSQSGASSASDVPSDSPDAYREESNRAQTSLEAQNDSLAPVTSPIRSIVVSDLVESGDGPAQNADVPVPSSMDNSGQYLIPDNNRDAFRSRVQESLRDPDDESLYARSYAPSDSFPRTPLDNGPGSRHSAAWTDYSVISASDVEVGQGYDEKPPTPPPKIEPLTISPHSPFRELNSFSVRPTTPLRSPLFNLASPRLPHSLSGPEVPPKPTSPSPQLSPRKVLHSPRPMGEDAPVSPRSPFGTAAVISSHRRTSSTTPQYAPGTGWIAQPPVPNSRPTSSMEKTSDGSSPSLRTSRSNEIDRVEPPAVLETGEQALALQKETKRLRDRQNIIREIIDSEAKHVKDMYVIKEIWQGTADACPKLSEVDKTILFGNIDEIAAFGARFLEKLKRANSGVHEGRRKAADGSRISSEDSLITADQDRLTCVGTVFVEFMSEIESVNWPFIIKFQDGQNHLETLLKDPAISIWDQECRRAMVDISECWDLKSLIIKPFQRIIKYKDLLERLATKTDTEHPDWANLQKAICDVKDFLLRLNQAMPPPDPPASTQKATSKHSKESDTRNAFLKSLARKTKSPLIVGSKPADEDEEYMKLRTTFSYEFLRLQIVFRDAEHYTRKVSEFVTGFVRILACIEIFLLASPSSSHPEIESKWTRFHIQMQSMKQTIVPEHIEAVRTEFIHPFEQLIELYQNPNIRMAERAKRRLDYEKTMQRRGNLNFSKDSQKSKTEKNAEKFVTLNEQLKKELPMLSVKTNQIAHICLGRLIQRQRQLYTLWLQKLRIVLEDDQMPKDVKSIVESFHNEFPFIDATVKELGITNPSFVNDLLKDLPLGRSSTQDTRSDKTSFSRTRESREQRSRPPSSNGKQRPPLLSRARAPSLNGSPSLPTPDFGRHNDGGFITPLDPNPPVLPQFGLGITESISRPQDNLSTSETLVNSQPASVHQSSGRPSTSRTSTSRTRPPYGGYDGACDDSFRKYSDPSDSAYQQRELESSYYFRRESDPSDRSLNYVNRSRPVSGSTTFSSRADGPFLIGRSQSDLDGSAAPGQPYSGVFQSAMPLSDGPDTYNTRTSRASSFSSLERTDDRGRGDGYNVLYLAASLFEFHIEDTKREGIYPYLTYEAGELFDVIGEKGELWLAKNQDDPPDKIKVGWIWSKHFARLAD